MSFLCDTVGSQKKAFQVKLKQASTLSREVVRKGVGLFSGVEAQVRFLPAPAGHGIVFQRVDLDGSPFLPAQLHNVRGTPRCTILGSGDVCIQTVEHLLAALAAFGVDNLLVQLSGPEVPVFDGSSLEFVKMIEESGVVLLDDHSSIYQLSQPIYWSEGDVQIVALPSEEYKISYTLHYPQSQLLSSQFFSVQVNDRQFKKEIAPCRTFSLYEEILPFIEKGLLKGGSLDNAVIVKDDKVMNPDGVRFPNEMARHKALDMIGDLSLVGVPFVAHVIAIRSGHYANNAFAKELLHHIQLEIS